jgi:hypothetical protein
MFKKLLVNFALLALIVTSVITVFSFSFPANAQATPNIYIDPPVTQTQTNATFSVDLDISAAQDVCSWQAYIYYKNDVLEAVSFSEGLFLKLHGSTMFDGNIGNNYNQTHGQLWMYCLRLWSGYGVDGNGTLATITFRAKTGGTSSLSLADTVLGNSSAQGIDHTTTDGQVNVGADDVSINSVNHEKTVVGQGLSMRINVTAGNPGNYAETFNVTSYANASSIAMQTVTLSSGGSTVVTFTWNTTGFAYGNYTISAYAWPVPGEINISNNNLTGGWVRVAGVGDLTGGTPNALDFVPDGKVDITDVAITAKFFGQKVPPAPANCDVSGTTVGVPDGKVDITDVATVAKHFGQHYTY